MSGYKKILLVVSEFPPGPGGIGNHAFNLAKYLEINKISVKVLTVSDYADKEDEIVFDKKQNFEIIRFKRYKNILKTIYERFRLVKKNIREGNFTHVIYSGRFSLFCSALLSKEKLRLKVISIVHGGDISTDSYIQRMLINRALKLSDLIIPVSKYSGTFIKTKVSENVIKVIPNGFDIENIDIIEIKDKAPINGKLNLVTVGTVWPRKGHHNVFIALPKVISEFPDLLYNIVGRHADLSKVQKYFEDSRFKKNILISGQVSDSDKIEILNSNHIFILLSESQSSGDFEGFGIAVIEANHFGLPAIGSKNSGLEDSIKDGVSGILVNPVNPDEVFNAIKSITENYSVFSKGAREWASQHHWSKIINSYITSIDKIN